MNKITSQVSEDITRSLFIRQHLNWNKVPKTKHVFLQNCTVYNYSEEHFPTVNERLSYNGCIFSKDKHDKELIGGIVYNTQVDVKVRLVLNNWVIKYSEETWSALVISKDKKVLKKYGI